MPGVLWHDGFGQYADGTDVGRAYIFASSALALTTGPRTGALYAKTSNGEVNFTAAVSPSTTTKGAVGARCKISTLSSTTAGRIFQIREVDGTGHLEIATLASGAIQVRRGSDGFGTVIGTSASGVVAVSGSYFIEAKFEIDNSAGTCEIRVDEVVVLTITGADTRNGGASGTWDYVQFGASGTYLCDIYIADAAGSHDYIGESQTDFHGVTAAGSNAGWTPDTGSNYQMVDDVPSDGATTKNAASTSGVKDSFAHTALKATGQSILAVTIAIDAQKSEAGTATLKDVVRHSGTDYLSATEIAPSTGSYRWLRTPPKETNPGTGAAWTEAGFNAAEFGYSKFS